MTSESEEAVNAARKAFEHLDSNFAASNFNLGTGTQKIFHQTGILNSQYNAQTQIFHNTTGPLTAEHMIKACQDALLTIRPEDHRAALISEKGNRAEGTCEWIKNNDEYQSLSRGDTRLLWIYGGPGKGKTMLSIYLTEDFEETQKVVYFFCQANDESRKSATYVLRGLIWQLTAQQPGTAQHLTDYLHTPGDEHPDNPKIKESVLASREALWSIFMKITGDLEFTGTFCLVDGLDECDEDSQRWLATKFTNLVDAHARTLDTSYIRVIIVSRPGIPVLRTSKRIVLDLDKNDQISQDIEAFIKIKVRELSNQLENLPDNARLEFEAEMQNQLLTRANGTFLWIGFAMIELLKKRTRTQMQDAMQELPSDLTALYDRMLLQVDVRHRSTCAKILRWVAFAARPLSINELGTIIDLKSTGLASTQQSTLDHLTMCEPFITISKYRVRLVHDTVRDYLCLPQDNRLTGVEEFHLQPSVVHLEMATTCLACIEQDHKAHGLWRPHASTWPRLLSEYATYNWPKHAQQSGDDSAPLIAASPSFFARKSPARDNWWYTFEKEFRGLVPDKLFHRHGIPELHMASYLGITSWTARLLSPATRLPTGRRKHRSFGWHGYRPLMHASIAGHTTIVKQLLYNGAKVDARDNDGRTALYHALVNQQDTIFQVLLGHAATLDIKDNNGYTILHHAVALSDVTAIRQLLKHVSSVDPKCKRGNTPLHIAAQANQVEIMQVLLDAGAEVNVTDSWNRTPLRLAIESIKFEDTRAISLLLERGAEVNACCSAGETSLHAAIKFWVTENTGEVLVKLLLQAGADPNQASAWNETPLDLTTREVKYGLLLNSYTVNSHTFEVLQILLSNGAKIDSLDACIILPFAAARGNEQLVKLILDLRLHSMHSAINDSGTTLLHLAVGASRRWCSMGPERRPEITVQIGQLLVDNGSDIMAKDFAGKTALHHAIEYGMEELVGVILDLGADVSIKDGEGKTTLQMAETVGNETLVRLLVDHGAEH